MRPRSRAPATQTGPRRGKASQVDRPAFDPRGVDGSAAADGSGWCPAVPVHRPAAVRPGDPPDPGPHPGPVRRASPPHPPSCRPSILAYTSNGRVLHRPVNLLCPKNSLFLCSSWGTELDALRMPPAENLAKCDQNIVVRSASPRYELQRRNQRSDMGAALLG